MSPSLIVAVDGPAASGKSTLARALADRLHLPFLDTGLLYRAVARRLLDAGIDPDDQRRAVATAEALQPGDVVAERLGSAEVGQGASKVAAFAPVRAALLPFQRNFARAGRGAVLAGRDVGTVVCPDAAAKLFVTASREERARRRHEELRRRDNTLTYADVLRELDERDRRDAERAVAPLRAATDALVLDTTQLDINAAVSAALAYVVGVREQRPQVDELPGASAQP